MRIKLHPHARAEIREARNWYFERSPLSAIAFAQTVENAIFRIREAPNIEQKANLSPAATYQRQADRRAETLHVCRFSSRRACRAVHAGLGVDAEGLPATVGWHVVQGVCDGLVVRIGE